MKELPTLERLKEVLDYCQKSGKFTWKVSHGKVLKGMKQELSVLVGTEPSVLITGYIWHIV